MVGSDLPWGQCGQCHPFATCLGAEGRDCVNTGLPSSLTHGLSALSLCFLQGIVATTALRAVQQEELLSGYAGPEIQVGGLGGLQGQ